MMEKIKNKYIQPIGFSEERFDMLPTDIGKEENRIGKAYYHDVKYIHCIHMINYGYNLEKTAPLSMGGRLINQPLIILN